MEMAGGPVLDTSTVSYDTNQSATHLGLGIGYTTGPVTFGANWGAWKTDRDFMRTAVRVNDDATPDIPNEGTVRQAALVDSASTGFGLTANYDLGGGAVIQLGFGGGVTKTVFTLDDGSETGALGDSYSVDTNANNWSLGLAFSF